jgi:CheY-like chemotaxis protein
MAKETDIRILMIEDELADMMLVNRELRMGGLTFCTERVESKEGFLRELEHEPPDLILSDHGLPSFDGFTALAIARDRCPEVPFIFVTNSLGEEKAIEAFERGAADCVLKSHLSKLVPAVQLALLEAEERRLQKWAEAERERMLRKLYEAVAKANTGSGLLPICSHCKKIRDGDNHWHALEIYFREHFNVEFTHGLCPQCVPVFFPGQLVMSE